MVDHQTGICSSCVPVMVHLRNKGDSTVPLQWLRECVTFAVIKLSVKSVMQRHKTLRASLYP